MSAVNYETVRKAVNLGALALVAVALGGCSSSAGGGMMHNDAMSPDGVQCYQFERNDAADRLGLPWGMVRTHEYLDPVGPGARHTAMTLNGPSDRANYPIGYWRHVEGGLEFGANGMGPLSLTLRPDGVSLRGTGRFVGDARPAGGGDVNRSPVDGVVAHQVMCGATAGS